MNRPQRRPDTITVRVPTQIQDWLDARKKVGDTLTDVVLDLFRQAIDQEQKAALAAQAEPKKQKRLTLADKQALFLEAIEQMWDSKEAALACGLPLVEVDGWGKDEGFLARLATSKARFVEATEAKLVRVGIGMIRGNPLALVSFLNAYSPNFDRMKPQMFERLVGPFISRVLQEVEKEAGVGVAQKIRERVKLMAEETCLKLGA